MSVLNNLKERTNAQISEIQACTSFDKAKIDARQIETLNIVSELIDFVGGKPNSKVKPSAETQPDEQPSQNRPAE